MTTATLELVLKATDEASSKLKGFSGNLASVNKEALSSKIALLEASQNMELLAARAAKTGTALDALKAEQAAQQFKALDQASVGAASSMGAVAVVGAAVGLALAAAVVGSLKLAVSFEDASIHFQNQAGLTDQAAKEVSEAVLKMGRDSEFSAHEMIQALAPVAGRVQTLTGRVIDASAAVEVLRASTDLADASMSDLKGTTSALVNVMLAYKIPLSQASQASDQLFNISRITGVGIEELGTAVGRMHEKLGVAAPSLADTGALIAEVASQGLTGSRGLLAVTSAIDTLTSGSTEVNKALHDLGVGVFDARGNFIGLRNVIATLAPAYASMTQAQQAATSRALFGSQVLTDSILAGLPAFDAQTQRINESGMAQQAAARDAGTVSEQLDILKNRVESLGTSFGTFLLLPVVTTINDWITGFEHLGTAIEGAFEANVPVLGSFGGALKSLAGDLKTVFDLVQSIPGPLEVGGDLLDKAFGSGGPSEAAKTLTNPRFTDLSLDLKEMDDAQRKVDALNKTVGKTPDLFADLKGAVADALKPFDALDPITEALKVQHAVLADYRLGLLATGASTDEVDAKINGLDNALQRQQEALNAAKGIVGLYTSELTQAGASFDAANAKGVALATALEGISAPQQIELIMNLPFDDINKMNAILAAFAETHDVNLALRLTNPEALNASIAQLELTGGVGAPLSPAAIAAATVPQLSGDKNSLGLGTAGSPSTAGIDKVTKSAGQADSALTALAAGFEAFHAATGGTVADFRAVVTYFAAVDAQTQKLADTVAAYKVAAIEAGDATFQSAEAFQKYADDRLDLEQRMARATTDLRAHEIEAADGAFQLQSALVTIAELFAQVGEAAGQLQLAKGALEGFQSALDGLLNQPTKESAAQQLTLDELKRRAALLEREGAKSGQTAKEGKDPRSTQDKLLDQLNKQIAAIQKEIEIRKLDTDIIKDKAAIAAAQNLTDADRARQAGLLTIAIDDSAKKVGEFTGAAFFAATASYNLALAFVDAEATVRAASGAALTLQEALVALSKLPDYGASLLPTTALGGIVRQAQVRVVGEAGPEAIIPLSQISSLVSGASGGSSQPTNQVNIAIHITADSEASDAAMRKLAQLVGEETDKRLRLAGVATGAVNQHSFAPVGRF